VLAALTIPVLDFELPPEVLGLGVITGLTYSLLAVGLVIVYKSSRVINFAHGNTGAVAAGTVFSLTVTRGWSYWLALPLALVAAAACGAAVEFLVIRRLARAPRLIVLVATIGAAQVLLVGASLALEEKFASGQVTPFPTPFEVRWSIGDLRLGGGHLLILLVVPVVAAALALFFQRTKIGVASRAAAENADAAELAGVRTRRVSVIVWSLAGLLAGVSAILASGVSGYSGPENAGPDLLVRALGACMIGGMTSIPRALVGGVVVGLAETLIAWNYPTGGMFEVVLLVIIVASMLVQKRLGALARGGEESSWSLAGGVRKLEPAVARLPRVMGAKVALFAFLGVALFLLPLPLDTGQKVLASSIVIFSIIGLSLVVLTGFAGQVSLGQFAFVGLGALAGGRLQQMGHGWFVCLLYALAAGGVAALVIGLPALRIRGLFLAVSTLAFAIASQVWLFDQDWLVQRDAGGSSTELRRPHLFGVDFGVERSYYYLCLVALVLVVLLVNRLRDTGAGRAMVAVRENEPNAAALGVPPRMVKLSAFVLAGMIASLGGFLYGGLLVNFRDTSAIFSAQLSLTVVAMAILGGVTTITGAVLGAIWVRGLGYLLGPVFPDLGADTISLLVSGPGLLLVLLVLPGGLTQLAFAARDLVLRLLVTRRRVDVAEPAALTGEKVFQLSLRDRAPDAEPDPDDRGAALEAEDIVVTFGGNVAVSHVSVNVRPGEILGLVGPNGAGKTTLFDVLAGQLRPQHGNVRLDGRDITDLRPDARARLGVGRCFQQGRLFGDMTVRDVLKVSLERRDRSEVVPSLLGLPSSRSAEQYKDLGADELLELFHLEGWAHHLTRDLSTGTRRMVEMATTVGLGARVLLLDEPTAGIAQRQVDHFRPVLTELRDVLGATMVIIEHDIPMITGLVDRLYVLAAGEVIAEGPPSIVREDPAVVAAYLGTDERAIAKSGASAAAAELITAGS
jgi:ABC-type branched-subunit amino acid transport system permease subunit/ABC-type branched-subunit amino acid transport system ATPase component